MLNNLTAFKLHKLLLNKEIKVIDIVSSIFKEIEEKENYLKAYITLTKEEAFKQAEIIDQKINNQEKISCLSGIPIAIKDNICMKGVLTTCGSKILQNFKPPYDAFVIEKLKEENVIFIGKTNMDEFAMGSSTENSYYGITHNPYNLKTVPGGSSGGSATAVASNETILSLGSDTGGSIRQPAAFCGIVGLKPTYGRISRYGLVAFASSLDQIGPMTKDVTDAAYLLKAIAKYDEKDSTCANIPSVDYPKYLVNDIKGVEIGIPKEYLKEGLDLEVENKFKDSINIFKSLGAKIKEISLPHTEYAIATYYLLATAEASSNLARYDGTQYGLREQKNTLLEMYKTTRQNGFGQEVKRRIMLGTYVLSAGYYEAYYEKAQKVRTLVKRDFEEAFKKINFILTPTTPTAAFKIGEKITEPLKMYLSDIFTVSVNLAGLPAISIPCGYTKENLPIGLQIIGQFFDEKNLIRIAYTFEKNTDFNPWVKNDRL